MSGMLNTLSKWPVCHSVCVCVCVLAFLVGFKVGLGSGVRGTGYYVYESPHKDISARVGAGEKASDQRCCVYAASGMNTLTVALQ